MIEVNIGMIIANHNNTDKIETNFRTKDLSSRYLNVLENLLWVITLTSTKNIVIMRKLKQTHT